MLRWSVVFLVVVTALRAQVSRPPIVWRPANAANYADNNRDTAAVCDSVVIHTGEGSYWGIISWFQNPNASASSHYVISSGGEITQMVADEDVSWHATYYNSRSIGIECEGYAGNAGTWTPEILEALVRLCAWLCQTYNIRAEQPAGDANGSGGYYDDYGLVGHYQVQTPGSAAAQRHGVRTDPGSFFPWTDFVARVRAAMQGARAADAPANLAATARLNGADASADFAWDASPNADGYYLDIALSDSDLRSMTGSFQNRNVGTSTSATWDDLALDTAYYWRVWASNSIGGNHGYPQSPVVTPAAPLPVPASRRAVLGLGGGGNGRLAVFSGARSLTQERWVRQNWTPYNAANGSMTPSCGDVDGDGKDEVVCGMGTYTASGGWVLVMEDTSFAIVRWIRFPLTSYQVANGETRPACGDVDGDGRAEIVVGMASHATSGGWCAIFDDAAAGYAFLRWVRIPWTGYCAANGETRPACGDLDGDGKAELAVGLGRVQGQGGWIAIFDDATGGHTFRRWARVDWAAYNTANGDVRPACGNLDGDTAAELALGLGRYTPNGGRLRVFDDLGTGLASLGWMRMAFATYNSANGETRPSIGDLDGDGHGEIVLGLGTGGGGWAYVAGPPSEAFQTRQWIRLNDPLYNARGGSTWPSVGAVR